MKSMPVKAILAIPPSLGSLPSLPNLPLGLTPLGLTPLGAVGLGLAPRSLLARAPTKVDVLLDLSSSLAASACLAARKALIRNLLFFLLLDKRSCLSAAFFKDALENNLATFTLD
jgi:hypothetical protein